MLRKIVLNIHIYSGLICFSYLLLLGISVLNFNHPFDFTKTPSSVKTWSQPLAVPKLKPQSASSPQQNNAAVAHAMGTFYAMTPSPDGKWIDDDTYHVHLSRPGKEYEIDAHPAAGTATIKQTRTGFWALTRDLHGSYGVYPDSLLASTWKGYTELCALVVIFAIISGVYLWAASKRERRIGFALVGVAGLISAALMLLVTFHG